MPKSIILLLALTSFVSVSRATWAAQSTTSAATLRDVQCRQNVCTTKCDAKGEKCLVTCDDKPGSNNCKKSFYRASPSGVLEVAPQRR